MNSRDDTGTKKSTKVLKNKQSEVKCKQSDAKNEQSEVRSKETEGKANRPDIRNKSGDVKSKQSDAKFKQYDVLYKVLVIGESSVGKSALINKYQNPDKPLPNLLPTIGIDYRLVDMVIDGLRVRVQLWDTVGQERYRTMTRNFFRGAKGILLLFDVTVRETFLLVEKWISDLKSNELDGEELFLVGNKIDLTEAREVKYEEGKGLASGYGMKYFETSAMTGANVKETIDQLIYNMKDANNPFDRNPNQSDDDESRWDGLFDNTSDDNDMDGNGEQERSTIRLNTFKKRKIRSRCCSGRNSISQ